MFFRSFDNTRAIAKGSNQRWDEETLLVSGRTIEQIGRREDQSHRARQQEWSCRLARQTCRYIPTHQSNCWKSRDASLSERDQWRKRVVNFFYSNCWQGREKFWKKKKNLYPQVLPVISKVCTVYQHDARLMERSCRCLRFAVRCIGRHSVYLLEPLVNQVKIQTFFFNKSLIKIIISLTLLALLSDYSDLQRVQAQLLPISWLDFSWRIRKRVGVSTVAVGHVVGIHSADVSDSSGGRWLEKSSGHRWWFLQTLRQVYIYTTIWLSPLQSESV